MCVLTRAHTHTHFATEKQKSVSGVVAGSGTSEINYWAYLGLKEVGMLQV